ncbi:P-loop containing nucleoside triphosphate hydrolase protein [Lobosporangium transversale]|uniref:Cell division control protein n=1 Tax=Lobosporangium transversale TaxID=64571 RepID=A0A1Y2GHM4_9FUNG|nr:P-loop containing nucleoside triphosphate hydrolase protein [Lobosporangium transversale]ORZ11309.1 P-loop containing nucleoside triphosphate hydrolase protein [Lobosporangium transversale]|eukprot:XP_021879624.1 P-loop containing nucleoside triphosphate hydrolase protein [Lobosporangium transversale]
MSNATPVTFNAKGRKSTRSTQGENENTTKVPGYSTPRRLQRSMTHSGVTDTAVPFKAQLHSPPLTGSSPNVNTYSSRSTPAATGLLGFYQDAKTMFRRTTEPHRLIGRVAEREMIQTFCKDHILTAKAGSLYISGQPGTGKTALLKEIMRDMEPEMKAAEHRIKTVMVNCMTIKDPKLVYMKLLQELGLTVDKSKDKEKDITVKALESLFLSSNDAKKNKPMYVVILDEIDQLLTKDQEVLYKLFEWSSMEGSRLTLFGIANALDMTDRFLPRLKARNCEPQLLNFNPYQVAEIRAIIMDRLFSLEGKDADRDEKDEKETATKVRVAPLMQRPAIELCARKVAAATGDLRKALDICRQTIEMVEIEAKKKERIEKLQLKRGGSPLSEIRLANLENQVAGGALDADHLTISRRQTGSFVDSMSAGSGVTIPTMTTPMTSPMSLQDAPKVTVEHVKRALASAFGSPVVQKMKALNVHQKIVLSVMVMKIQSGKAADCEVGKVFDHYTATCRSSNKVSAVNRGEYQDLINMLEANGLITLSKAKEERLRKIGLVPRESEVLDAVKGQDILDTILAKSGLKLGESTDV